jgi:hypothetical protein
VRLASVILVGAMSATASAGPGNGRVVRVERPRALGIPRLCELTNATQGLCVGAPKAGERIVIVDKTELQILGEFRIDQVTPSLRHGRCDGDAPKVFEVEGKVVSGNVDVTERLDGFRNLSVGPSSRLVKNQALPPGGHGDVLLALDGDGDGTTDLVVTRYSCDDRGVSDVAGNRLCFDTYRARDGRLQLVDRDRVKLCK